MSHINKITDKDPCFEVDPITRAIKNVSRTKTAVMQFDHNSERFTFTLPRYIEGHDMAEVTKAEVHYLNVDTAGVYPMNDIAVDEADKNKITCSWLISQNATMKPGSLTFLLRFVCLSADGSVEYAWHTGTHTGISVSAGMNNLADVVEDVENDITAQWKAELFAEFEEIRHDVVESEARVSELEQISRQHAETTASEVVLAASYVEETRQNANAAAMSATEAFEHRAEAEKQAEEIKALDIPDKMAAIEREVAEVKELNASQDNEIVSLMNDFGSLSVAISQHAEQISAMTVEKADVVYVEEIRQHLYDHVDEYCQLQNDVVDMNEKIGDIDAALENIIAIQDSLIGGDA